MKVRVLRWWDSLRTSYWFVPGIMCAGSIGLALWTTSLDSTLPGKAIENLGFLWTGSAEGARELLSTVASSMITVAGVTFSITIVVLSQASSQFGPRLLRSYMRDTGNQVVLGTFVATFTYCLLVLRQVHSLEDQRFVPQISVTCAVVLALASLTVLIYYIHHTCDSIQAENLVAMVGKEMLGAIATFPPRKERARWTPLPQQECQFRISGSESGYLQAVDLEGLASIAREHDAVFELVRHSGDFVAKGSCVVRGNQELDKKVMRQVQQAFIVGRRRTPTQDLNYQLHQLVEIAVRALSPGVNDPFTAITCIDWLGASLLQALDRELPDGYTRDEDGVVRVRSSPEDFAHMCGAAFHQIRQNGARHLSIALRLTGTLERLIEKARTEQDIAVLTTHAREVREEFLAGDPIGTDREVFEAELERFERARTARSKEIERKPLHGAA